MIAYTTPPPAAPWPYVLVVTLAIIGILLLAGRAAR